MKWNTMYVHSIWNDWNKVRSKVVINVTIFLLFLCHTNFRFFFTCTIHKKERKQSRKRETIEKKKKTAQLHVKLVMPKRLDHISKKFTWITNDLSICDVFFFFFFLVLLILIQRNEFQCFFFAFIQVDCWMSSDLIDQSEVEKKSITTQIWTYTEKKTPT